MDDMDCQSPHSSAFRSLLMYINNLQPQWGVESTPARAAGAPLPDGSALAPIQVCVSFI